MGYKNGIEVLPAELIAQIQQYIDGEYIYIPRIIEKRRKWGDNTDYRRLLEQRNLEIVCRHRSGASVKQLAKEYHISPQGIYKILSKYKS